MPIGGTIHLTARNCTFTEKEHHLLTKGNYVKISIRDTGVGMPREMINRIFDPFFTTKSKGHGLGLPTCYSIINRHGGCMEVDSEPGKGSVFHVYLPASEQTPLPAITKPAGKHRGSGTIIVMDDEPIVRDVIRAMLSLIGYTVVCTDDGREAIDFFTAAREENRPVAGMIFDLTVPGGMGGKEAVAEIRKMDANVPVFVASGYAEAPVMTSPAEYGFTARICKPFVLKELMDMLNQYLTGAE
jgi:CheY-like chemotaxis protein